MSLTLISPAFEEGEDIPKEYTCDGENINPPLIIDEVPEDTISLVLIVDDPDSPSGDFVHWLVWNMPAETLEIPTGELPDEAIEGYNDFGKPEYGGPCPASGEHSYNFRLYALDTEIELDEDSNRKKLEKEMAGHILDETLLTGVYKR